MSTKDVQQLSKKLDKLMSKVEQPKAAAKKKSGKNKKKKAGPTMPVPGTSAGPSRASGKGEFTFSRKEYLGQIETTKPSGKSSASYGKSVFLTPQAMPWLKNLSKCFERYRWNSLTVQYIPDVGATKDGSIAMGIDWDQSNVSSQSFGLKDEVWGSGDYDRLGVVSLTPSQVTPLWKPASIALPKGLLQSRKWYTAPSKDDVPESPSDFGTGFLAVFASSSDAMVVGDVWVSYSVTFAGTRKV